MGNQTDDVVFCVTLTVFNVILNWVLIFGPAKMGFKGAPVATSICRWFQLLLAIVYALGPWSTRDRASKTRPVRWFMPRHKLIKLSKVSLFLFPYWQLY